MDSVAQSFLSEIERFLSSAGVDPTALGKQALGDPNFVFDLRKGRSPSTRTLSMVRVDRPAGCSRRHAQDHSP